MMANTTGVLNVECTAKVARLNEDTAGASTAAAGRLSDKYDCLFPQHFAQYINTPMHVTQSQYDSFQLGSILHLPCHSDPTNCNATELEAFQAYRKSILIALNASGLLGPASDRRTEKLLGPASNQRSEKHSVGKQISGGIWNDACIAHTQGYYGDYMDNPNFEVPAGSGMTLAKSLMQWWEGTASAAASVAAETAVVTNYHVDAVQWPNNAPCKSAHAKVAAADVSGEVAM
jgi:hypothetical protein